MGLKIIQLESGGKLLENYLCQMSAAEFAEYRPLIPETLTGAEYTDLYGLLPDIITRVNPAETYHPRACAEHPITENERVKEFAALNQPCPVPAGRPQSAGSAPAGRKRTPAPTPS